MSYLSEDRTTEMLAKLQGQPEEVAPEQSVVEETVSPQVEPDVEASSAEPEEEVITFLTRGFSRLFLLEINFRTKKNV